MDAGSVLRGCMRAIPMPWPRPWWSCPTLLSRGPCTASSLTGCSTSLLMPVCCWSDVLIAVAHEHGSPICRACWHALAPACTDDCLLVCLCLCSKACIIVPESWLAKEWHSRCMPCCPYGRDNYYMGMQRIWPQVQDSCLLNRRVHGSSTSCIQPAQAILTWGKTVPLRIAEDSNASSSILQDDNGRMLSWQLQLLKLGCMPVCAQGWVCVPATLSFRIALQGLCINNISGLNASSNQMLKLGFDM